MEDLFHHGLVQQSQSQAEPAMETQLKGENFKYVKDFVIVILYKVSGPCLSIPTDWKFSFQI